ncbi:hypothetical protein TNCV_986181 [Trichonephila clavipes]|uniref:Uncharacterized protein n=1 Tax=Trichonephila clavipes TaxID=2585209 RepID=A0A8X6SKG1_TRICX|nr:hypothetical protein TNCV_986181 [Trichonephila clavipes]
MSIKSMWTMIRKFEETGKLRVHSGRGRKLITAVLVDGVKTAADAQLQTLEFGAIMLFLERQAIRTIPSEKYSKHIVLLPIHDPPNQNAA